MSLKNLLKTNKKVRKIFGKKEIEIILKQLDGIPLTQSEKNRLSRDIRVKLDVIKEIAKNELSLKKDSSTKKQIEKALKLILKDKLKERIKAVLLFGSHAKGNVTRRSDIDICVIFDDIERKEATKFRIRIMGEFSEKMDIQVFNILPEKIKRSIAANHKLIFQRKDFDNMEFTARYLSDEDYTIRIERFRGAVA